MLRLGTFNGNQFISHAKWVADLLVRLPALDRLALQEAVHFDAHAFVADPKVIAKVGAWGAIQTREGNDDGRANTAVLYRLDKGVPDDTALVDLGKADGPAKDQHTRDRLLCAGRFPEGWFGSFHGFPERDDAFNKHLVEQVGKWARSRQRPVWLGADVNKIPHHELEAATGLTWHGVGIDGFLGAVSRPTAFPTGFSDHAGVHAGMRLVPAEKAKVTELKRSKRKAVRDGRQERASRLRKAIHALRLTFSKPLVWTFPALAQAKHQSVNGPVFAEGTCLQQVRTLYRIGPSAPSAIAAWQAAKVKHPETDPAKIPEGYPVFWSGGSHGFGHIAVKAAGISCWSSDIVRTGFFDLVPVSEIHAKWGLTLLGWTEDLNGAEVVAKVVRK